MSKYLTLAIMSAILIFLSCTGESEDHQYTGILEGTSVRVPALTPGEIIDMFVETGNYVERGQLLAVIDSTELTFQRERFLASAEELNIQTEVALTNLARVKDDFTYLKTKFDRIETLYKSQSVTKQQLDDMGNNLQNANAAMINARQTLNSIAAKSKQIEAQIKSIDKKIKDTKITAPINGIIVTNYFENGEAVPAFGAVFEIIDIATMEVKIYISEQLLAHIKHSDTVRITVDGLEKTLPGDIIWISPKAEFTPKTILTPDTRTSLVYAVKVSVKNEDGILKHGMPVVITL